MTFQSRKHVRTKLPTFCLIISLLLLLINIIIQLAFICLSINSRHPGVAQLVFLTRGNEHEYFKNHTCAEVFQKENRFQETLEKLITDKTSVNSDSWESNLWTRVSDTVYIYSAYLDTRDYYQDAFTKANNLSLIRIVGLVRMPPIRELIRQNPMQFLKIRDEKYLGSKYYCRVFKENDKNGRMDSVNGSTLNYSIIEEGVKIFSSAFINCYVNLQNLGAVDNIFVSLYPVAVSNYPDKLIPVVHLTNGTSVHKGPRKSTKSSIRTLSVCVRPLFGPMDDLHKLEQFVSYYYTMGVSRFTFYKLSISPTIKKYLRSLVDKGKINISLKYWNLPAGNVSELWDFGTLAALNDCLYTNMKEDNVIFVDIDEFIVPQKSEHRNLVDLVNSVGEFNQLLVRNTFFCSEFCTKVRNNSFKPTWTIFDCYTRTKRVWTAKMRSKYIVKPAAIVSVGHHLVTKYTDQTDHRFSKNSVEAKTDVALLYHYRECRSISTRIHPVLNRLTVTDNKMSTFKTAVQTSLPNSIWNLSTVVVQ